jgi:hypothetical protein
VEDNILEVYIEEDKMALDHLQPEEEHLVVKDSHLVEYMLVVD